MMIIKRPVLDALREHIKEALVGLTDASPDRNVIIPDEVRNDELDAHILRLLSAVASQTTHAPVISSDMVFISGFGPGMVMFPPPPANKVSS